MEGKNEQKRLNVASTRNQFQVIVETTLLFLERARPLFKSPQKKSGVYIQEEPLGGGGYPVVCLPSTSYTPSDIAGLVVTFVVTLTIWRCVKTRKPCFLRLKKNGAHCRI